MTFTWIHLGFDLITPNLQSSYLTTLDYYPLKQPQAYPSNSWSDHNTMSATANKIIVWKNIGTITKAGTNLVLGAATKTDKWSRPELAVEAIKEPFKVAVIAYKSPLPQGTAEVIAR